ncbi:hypothetical protein M9H77_23171 [Catharanthus roseus]|uniref:Uncharacterized protein n=1 Tax=Catharanthus roseus TaxID=4058 RepID=A0ACC0AWL1_CATRO|nr:hypothetical protein M9H77_23171 [Catharanthus roseus]
MEGQIERVRKHLKERRMATHLNRMIGKDEETPHFHFPSSKVAVMPPKSSAASNKKSRATVSPSNNKHILPLPYRISDEANMMWYNAKLRNGPVVECTLYALLESQVGVLENFRVMG